MARIRTVKPEFWTDEKVVECSIPARLLFIGLFNFANDVGCLERSPKRIKMQVFPADVIDCEPLLAELIAHGLIIEYSVSGVGYLQIKGFRKHQKINRPSATKLPMPPESSKSGCEGKNAGENTHESFSDDSRSGNGEITDGRDTDTEGKRSNPSLMGSPIKNSAEPTPPRYLEGVDEPIGKFTMSSAWLPSRDFRQRAAHWGVLLPEPDYLTTELAEFSAYWNSEGKVFTQIQWEQKFARHIVLVRSKKQSETGGTDNAGVRTEPTTSRAVQQIDAAYEQWCRRHGVDGSENGMAAMAGYGGNILEPMDAEERGGTFGTLDSPDRFDD
ncbi:hypothetical protein EGM70_04865 [Enterobacteriaceae bacterium 89]|nr:hypothetical protein [Enterobacteriaceae bacterium 89]